MPCLRTEPLNPLWSEFVTALFRDLEPLGHTAVAETDSVFALNVPDSTDGTVEERQSRWSRVHHLSHQALIRARRAEVLAFEEDFAPIFVDMAAFQPSAVRPELQIVDFEKREHLRIVDYLKLYQSVTAGKPVGRRAGLLIWDTGQSGPPRLFGGAILASARFSQRLRDHYFG
jgi:hypothetical protein